MVNLVNIWVKVSDKFRQIFQTGFLLQSGFKITDSFGQYFTSFAFFKYDQPNPTYGWDVKNQKSLLTHVRTGLDEYLRARIEQK